MATFFFFLSMVDHPLVMHSANIQTNSAHFHNCSSCVFADYYCNGCSHNKGDRVKKPSDLNKKKSFLCLLVS